MLLSERYTPYYVNPEETEIHVRPQYVYSDPERYKFGSTTRQLRKISRMTGRTVGYFTFGQVWDRLQLASEEAYLGN